MPTRSMSYSAKKRKKTILDYIDNSKEGSNKNSEGCESGTKDTRESTAGASNRQAPKTEPLATGSSSSKKPRMRDCNNIERILIHNGKVLVYSVPHSFFPAFNVGMTSMEASELLSPYPSCVFSVPRPVYVAAKHCDRLDLCHRRPMIYEAHRKRLLLTRAYYQRVTKSQRSLREGEKSHIYHASVYDMAERVHLDPDPFFHGSYDYYYSGGNLGAVPIQNRVLHVDGENLQTLNVSKFPRIKNYTVSTSLLTASNKRLEDNSEIFEILPLCNGSESFRQDCFVTRQRNVVTLHQWQGDNVVESITQFRTKSTPFVACAQSTYNPNVLLISNMKQHVRSYDIGQSVPSLVKGYEIDASRRTISWNTLKAWREHTYFYANEQNLLLLDTRTTPDQWLQNASKSQDEYFPCDHISALALSKFSNLLYVATNHKLHCLDIRRLSSNFGDSNSGICRWSHQLEHAPLLIDTFRVKSIEYVALASPVAGDLSICQLSRKRNEEKLEFSRGLVPKHIYSSSCLPYQPPTLREAYESARLAGRCLQPEADLPQRIRCCTTGLTFFDLMSSEDSECLALLLTSNSNGDVFSHTLTHRENQVHEPRTNPASDDMMHRYAKTICTLTQPPLNYTDIVDITGMRKVFRCKFLSAPPKIDLDAMDDVYSDDGGEARPEEASAASVKPKKRRSLGRWQKPLSTLYSYKDALVQDLLAVWDIDIDDEKDVKLDELGSNLLVKPSANAIVSDWLNGCLPKEQPMTSIPTSQVTKYMDNTECDTLLEEDQFNNLPQSTQIMDDSTVIASAVVRMESSALDLQPNSPLNTTYERRKATKRKIKYVKGF